MAVLDNFNRANETLAGDGLWGKLDPVEAGSLTISSNQVAKTGAGYGKAYWLGISSASDVDVAITVAVLPASSGVWVNARLSNAGDSLGNWNGYEAAMLSNGHFQIDRVTNGSSTTIAFTGVGWDNTGPFTLTAGDKLRMRCSGTTISVWQFTSGAWQLRTSATDATYTSGQVGIESQDTTARLDDFDVVINDVPSSAAPYRSQAQVGYFWYGNVR